MAAAGEIKALPSIPVNFSETASAFAPVRDFTTSFYVHQVKGGKLVAVNNEPFDFTDPPKSLS
jgi:hypothetical protein